MEVFITKKGEKYHTKKKCIMNYKYETVSIEEAKKMGKTLCQNCEKGIFFNKKYKKQNYNKKKEIIINDNAPDDIIYNNSIIKNEQKSNEDYITEKIAIYNNDIKGINDIFNIDNNNNIIINQKQYSDNLIMDNDNSINNNEKNNKESKERININKYNNNDNNYLFKKEISIAEKIQNNIERDKLRANNIMKKIESIHNKGIIYGKEYNHIEESKEEDSSSHQSLTNYKTIASRQISLCGIGDMDILEDTYKEAVYINLTEKDKVNINNNKFLQNGKYKFKFEIKKLKQDMMVEIEVGFKIKYTNSLDINYKEKDKIKYQKNKFKLGTFSDKLIETKDLIINEDTDIIYVFINIKDGKFFIIGKNELEKIKQKIILTRDNTEIFYIKNCGPLYYKEIRKIEPIFKFEENSSEYCKIKLNGKTINK